MAVKNEEDLRRGVVDEPLQELAEEGSFHLPPVRHEPHGALRGDGRDHVEREPGACGRHHRRAPLYAPGGSPVVVRSDPRLVLEVDLRLFPPGELFYLRIVFFDPLLHEDRVLLESPHEGFLTGEAELLEEPTHRDDGEPDAVLPFYELFHHLSRPERKGEPQLEGILRDDGSVNPPELRTVEFQRSPHEGPCFQGLRPSFTIECYPPVHGTAVHSQGPDEHLGALSLFYPPHRPYPDGFQHVMPELSSIGLSHASSILQ